MRTMSNLLTRHQYPCGWWRCTHSKEGLFKDHFTVGELYECRIDNNTSPRIYYDEGADWAPYWSYHYKRFCYSPSELSFEYVGLIKPEVQEPDNSNLKKQIQFHLDTIQSLLKNVKG